MGCFKKNLNLFLEVLLLNPQDIIKIKRLNKFNALIEPIEIYLGKTVYKDTRKRNILKSIIIYLLSSLISNAFFNAVKYAYLWFSSGSI